MTNIIPSFDATLKERDGKGASRELRRKGNIPAIIYGGKGQEIGISINAHEMIKEYSKGHFLSRIFDLNVGNEKVRVLPREVQIHPVTDIPMHVDFMRIEKDARVRVFVAVKFLNYDNSPGIKRGGVLNIVRRDVELICDSNAIPEKLIVDLAGLNIGETVHISSVSIPSGCEPTIKDRDFTIATIVGRMAKDEDAVVAVAGEEGEEAEEGETEENAAEE